MAFLCPARRKKSKIRIKGARPFEAPLHGRITGSASIDTLVRVGLEKQYGTRTPMVVLHDFSPCVDDEIAVKRDQLVHLLYQENDWMYVIAADGKEGFIPYTYCLPVQRSVDDFLAHKTKKKRGDDSGNLQSPQTKYFDQHAVKSESRSLVRTSSKSMPDISDIGTNSSDSTSVPLRNARHSSHNHGRPVSYNFDHIDQTLSADTPAKHRYGLREDSTVSNRSEEFLDTSAADLRKASSAIQQKQKQYLRSKQESRTRSSNPGTVMTTVRSAPASPQSQYSHHSKSSHSHSTHSTPSHHHASPHQKQYSAQQIRSSTKKYQDITGIQRQDPGKVQTHHGRSGSISEDMFNKSWGGSASVPHTPHSRSLNNSAPSYPGQYSSSRSYINHPYSITSNSHHKHQYAHSSSNVPINTKSNNTNLTPHVRKFHKTAQGQFIVLFQFAAQQENDISVERGEFVTVLNKDDSDWYWVKRSDNQEGFVPSNYVRQADSIPLHPDAIIKKSSNSVAFHQQSVSSPSNQHGTIATNKHLKSYEKQTHLSDHPQYTTDSSQHQASRTNQAAPHGSTRLVCSYDYRAAEEDDLTVTRGETLFADFDKQEDPDWLWVFSPKQSKSGYIPRTYAKYPNFASMQRTLEFVDYSV